MDINPIFSSNPANEQNEQSRCFMVEVTTSEMVHASSPLGARQGGYSVGRGVLSTVYICPVAPVPPVFPASPLGPVAKA